MIKLTNEVYIGIAADGEYGGLPAVLNVACDLKPVKWRFGNEYAQVGLVDGPGNPTSSYCAVVLVASSLVFRYGTVLIVGHDLGRALAVAAMYLKLSHDLDWDQMMGRLRERVEMDLPEPHQAHRAAYDRMPWDWLRGMLK